MRVIKTAAIALGASALAFATPAAAQLQVYEDYEPSDAVTELTFVKVDEGQFDTYLEGLQSTWVAANKIQQELGYISSFAIYGVPYGENDFNLVLRVTYPSTESLAPSKERYLKFLEAYGQANIDRGNQTVLELYNKIRKIQATYALREVKMIEK